MPSDDGTAYNDGDLGIDNIFYYGADVTAADAELILGDDASTGEKPTDPSGNTGDVQLWVEITAAAAAIVAVTAVAVSRKKKSQE